MRIQQRKKRSEAVSERPVEPNEKLGDIKPQLSAFHLLIYLMDQLPASVLQQVLRPPTPPAP